MKAIHIISLFTIAIFLMANIAFATIITVPTNEPTIQDGIIAANTGDTVMVEPGTYVETIDFLGKNIKVISLVGPENTIIVAPLTGARSINSGSGSDTTVVPRSYTVFSEEPVVVMASGEPKGAEISGFTITGGGKSGIYCYGTSPIITNNIIAKNRSDYTNGGGGIDLNNTSGALVKNNTIYANEADTYGGGIHLEFSENDTICYNLLYDNLGYGTIRSLDANSIFYNNTIDVVLYAGILNQRNGSVEVQNNIVVNSPQFAIQSSEDANISASYNCTWNCITNYSNCIPGPGAINVDPLFIDEFSKNYNLNVLSPCVDAGNPDLFFNDPNDTRNDMGAFPSTLPVDLPVAVELGYSPSINNSHILSFPMNIFWTYYDDAASTQHEYQVQVGTDNDWTVAEMWDSGPITSALTNILYDGTVLDDRTFYFLRIRVNNGSEWGGWINDRFITHFNRIIYIPADYSTIQGGISYAIDFDTIVVSPGLYEESINFIGKRILLISSDGPDVTTIQAPETDARSINSANNSDTALVGRVYTIRSNQPVVTFSSIEPKGTEISGFTITGGGRSGIYCNGSSPTITNNIITGNFSDYENGGAGIDMNSTMGSMIKGNIFFDNEANTYGAAIHLEYSGNDTICYNLSYGNLGYGDIRCLEVHSMIYNNTILPETWSGITNQRLGSFIDARNNIIAYGIYGIASGDECITNASYNDTWGCETDDYYGVTPGEGTIYDNPFFIDMAFHNYRLQSTSPCIDAGDTNSFFNDPDGTRNDMGAFPTFFMEYPCGDVNLDDTSDILDIIALINYYFNNGVTPEVTSAADLNCDAIVGLTDIVLLHMFVFHDGQADCCD
ncbi:MAG: hypothetical protein GY855_03270 [candidate division Zixibacteria bacterium]|nr:hypothetical protein [candidate division Zixibacteria bacterium]